MRSMPITAFLPAFIALFGMDEGMKVGFLFFGMFFYLLALVVEQVNRVDHALLETAYTLGAKVHHV
jgi:ABC-type nitrate/sulfonate/bicarbonate transport system permease component